MLLESLVSTNRQHRSKISKPSWTRRASRYKAMQNSFEDFSLNTRKPLEIAANSNLSVTGPSRKRIKSKKSLSAPRRK